MSKLLKNGLKQNHKILNAMILCFIIIMVISSLTSGYPLVTFKSLLAPYCSFIIMTYIIFMIIPRIMFKQKLSERLKHDGLDDTELDQLVEIEGTVFISQHYLLHIPSQTIIGIHNIAKVVIRSNHQITSLMFVSHHNQSHVLVLKTAIIDEIINCLNDPSINDEHIKFEKYHDENLKDQFSVVNIIIILTLIILGILIAIHFIQ